MTILGIGGAGKTESITRVQLISAQRPQRGCLMSFRVGGLPILPLHQFARCRVSAAGPRLFGLESLDRVGERCVAVNDWLGHPRRRRRPVDPCQDTPPFVWGS